MPPPRVIVAVLVLAGLAALGAWGVRASVRARHLSKGRRLIAGAVAVGVLGLLAAWVIFAWPAYWD